MGGWDPLESQDQWDVELVLLETEMAQKVRRSRVNVFNSWAHRNGIHGPKEITPEAWLEFATWLEIDQDYAPAYRKHVIMEVREWLAWAAERGYCDPIELGQPIPQHSLEMLCRAHRANTFDHVGPFEYQQREMILGLVFGVGMNPDRLHELLISDYDFRRHTLLGVPMDPRAEKLVQRYLGPRMRRPRGTDHLLAERNGTQLQPTTVRVRLNDLLRTFGGLPPVDRNRVIFKWMPTPHRDFDLVLDILSGRPVLQARKHAYDAGLVIRGILNLAKQKAVALDTDHNPGEGIRMAIQMKQVHVCDRCGDEGFPITIGWPEGTATIDLCQLHLTELVGNPIEIEDEAPTNGAKPKVTNGKPAKPAKITQKTKTPSLSTEARKWARENGIEVPKRGKVPSDIIVRYQAMADRSLAAVGF